MRNALLLAAGTLVLTFGCSRDLTVPEPPGPGSVSGRVLLATPGTSEKVPVSGAEVRVLGSGFAATTTPAGTFTVDNLELTNGLLLVRTTVAGELKQRVLQLSEYGTGPQKRVNLGDIIIGENARVTGKVRRADVSTASGHIGTTVFVPAGPFTAITADDGSYTFEQVPEGPLEMYAFRDGYAPISLGQLTLRSGETVVLRDVFLQPATSMAPGTLTGKLAFLPATADLGDARVRLVGSSNTIDVSVTADFSFTASAVPVGLYRLVATRTGYGPLEVINVLVASGTTANVGTLTLTTAPAFDAGPPPAVPDASVTVADAGQPDAGQPDAGSDGGAIDAGTDAGVSDAGVIVPCTDSDECTLAQWCDVDRCVPLCSIDAECGFGRVCQTSTRTCVKTCVGQCPAGQVCNASNVCQAVCDATFPCPAGQKCATGICVPECSINADCANPFLSCNLGRCARNDTCTGDTDCLREQICVLGQCGARPTSAQAPADGGGWTDGGLLFTCSTECDCKAGERCSSGYCEPDITPNRFLKVGASGNGLSPSTPSGNFTATLDGGNVTVALLNTDTWDVGTTSTVLGHNTTIAGGFKECGVGRWVRSRDSRTVITGAGGIAGLYSNGILAAQPPAGSSQANNVTVSGLLIRGTGTGRCQSGVITFKLVNGLTVEDVDFDLQMAGCANGSARTYGMYIADGSNVLLRRVRLVGHNGTGGGPFGIFEMTRSTGTIDDISSVDVSTAHEMNSVVVTDQVGPITLKRLKLGRISAPAQGTTRQVYIGNCANSPVHFEDSQLAWPAYISGSGGFTRVVTTRDCNAVDLKRVSLDIDGHSGLLFGQNVGAEFENSGGTIDTLIVPIPTTSTAPTATTGVRFAGPRASFVASNVQVSNVDGNTRNSNLGTVGIRFDSILTGVATVTRSSITLLRNTTPTGILTTNSTTGSMIPPLVSDSVITVDAVNSCSVDVNGVRAEEPIRLERNIITVTNGALGIGVRVSSPDARTQLYGNSIRAGYSGGSAGCAGYVANAMNGSHSLYIESTAEVRAIGNTFDPVGATGQTGLTSAVTCTNTVNNAVTMESNIFTSGRGPERRFLTWISGSNGTGTICFTPQNFTRNAFISYVASPPTFYERLFDGGVLSTGNNTYLGTTSCFAAPALLSDGGLGFPHYLAPGSPCADQGSIGARDDLTPLSTDLFGRTRDGGLGPDLGAVEGGP